MNFSGLQLQKGFMNVFLIFQDCFNLIRNCVLFRPVN